MSQEQRSTASSRRLLTAAVELIAEKGFERTSAVEISLRAGYSREMVRARYGSKEALMEALLRSEYEPMFLAPLTDDANSGLRQILARIEYLAQQAEQSPELLKAFFTVCFEVVRSIEPLGDWLRGWLDRYAALACRSLRAGQDEGSVLADLDPVVESQRIITYGLGIAFRWLLSPDNVDFPAELRTWAADVEAQLGCATRRSVAS